MTQKIIDPFSLKRKEIYPGIEVRKDSAINVKAEFTIDFNFWKKYLLNRTIIMLSNMPYSDMRRIKSLFGVSNSSPIESSAVEIVESLVTDISVIIRNLTSKRTQYELMGHVKSDFKELPSNVFRIIKHINSCNLTTHIIGTEASLFNFTDLTVIFTDKGIGAEHTHNPEYTLGKVLKLNEAMILLNIDKIVGFEGIQSLFGDSEDLFNTNIISSNKNDKLIQFSEDSTPDDLNHCILCLPKYILSDATIIRAYNVKITDGQFNDILQVPIEMLTNSAISYASNKKVVNDYIVSKVPTRLGELPVQYGMVKTKGFDVKLKEEVIRPKPVKKNKNQKFIERLDETMESEVKDLNAEG